MKLCGDDGGMRKDGRPCRANTNPPSMTRCRRHPRGASPEELAAIAVEMGREGGLAAAKAKLADIPADLSTPARQQEVLERVVGSALAGKLNARAAQAVVTAISVSRRLYETVVLEERIRAVEARPALSRRRSGEML